MSRKRLKACYSNWAVCFVVSNNLIDKQFLRGPATESRRNSRILQVRTLIRRFSPTCRRHGSCARVHSMHACISARVSIVSTCGGKKGKGKRKEERNDSVGQRCACIHRMHASTHLHRVAMALNRYSKLRVPRKYRYSQISINKSGWKILKIIFNTKFVWYDCFAFTESSVCRNSIRFLFFSWNLTMNSIFEIITTCISILDFSRKWYEYVTWIFPSFSFALYYLQIYVVVSFIY